MYLERLQQLGAVIRMKKPVVRAVVSSCLSLLEVLLSGQTSIRLREKALAEHAMDILYCILFFSTPLYSTLLQSTLLYLTRLYSTRLYATLRYATLLYSTLLFFTLLYSTLLYSTHLYSTLVCSIALCCTLTSSSEIASRGLIGSALSSALASAEAGLTNFRTGSWQDMT